MSGFDEVLLDLAVAFGARGGPETSVDVVQLASGGEARNARWAGMRRRWDAGGVVMRSAETAALVEFFEARGGRLRGFRFRDVLDWKSCALGEAVSDVDQVLGVGDGAASSFQLVKGYASGAVSWERVIVKPVTGSVVAALDGVATDAFDVDGTTGVVTLDAAPGVGVVVSAGFAFDVPVRFDVDRLETVVEAADVVRVDALGLVEVIG